MKILVELLKLGLNHDPTVLRELHRVIKSVWHQRKIPQRWRDAVINVLHKRRIRPRTKTIAASHLQRTRVRSFSRAWPRDSAPIARRRLLPKKQCGFPPHRPMTDMMFAVRRLEVLGRKARVPLFLCFIDLQKAYDSVDRTLL